MRFFNTSGPVVPADHYCIPPLTRVDLDDVCQLVRNKRYFVLHAPRQTGKTSILLALRDLLNSGEVGEYRCVYFNVEAGQAGREDTTRAMRAIFGELAAWARSTLRDSLPGEIWSGLLDELGPDGALGGVLRRWAEADSKPLVLLIDEIDSLVGRHVDLRAAPAPRRLRPATGGVSAERGAVRRARRARLPYPLGHAKRHHPGRQRVQHQGPVDAPGRPDPGGGAGVARAAHRGDGGRSSLRRRWNRCGRKRKASPGS